MDIDDIKPGMTVVFGRPNGEKTRAEVVKRNQKTVTVRILEPRGRQRLYEEGAEFRVSPALVRPARGGQPPTKFRKRKKRKKKRRKKTRRKSRRTHGKSPSKKRNLRSAAREADELLRKRCSLTSPPVYVGASRRYLDGRKINRSGREYDFQRSKFYRAQQSVERNTGRGRDFDSIGEVRDYVRDLESQPWFQDRFGDHHFQIKHGRGKNSAHWGDTGNIRIATNHRYELVVLHEITHVLVPPPHSAHGRLYAHTFLAIIDWRMSLGEALEDAYRAAGVVFEPHDEVQEPYRSRK